MRSVWPLILIFAIAPSHAQVAKWQLGGSGAAWDQRDSLQVLVDFADGAIQPLYLQPHQNVISPAGKLGILARALPAQSRLRSMVRSRAFGTAGAASAATQPRAAYS